MRYSEEFKHKVLAAFDADDSRLRSLLEEGSPSIGRILNESTEIPFTAFEMLTLFESGKEHVIYEKLKKVACRERLHSEWVRQYSREHM